MHVYVCDVYKDKRLTSVFISQEQSTLYLVLLEEGLSLISGALAGYPVNFRDQPVFASLVLGSPVLGTIPALMGWRGSKELTPQGHMLYVENTLLIEASP